MARVLLLRLGDYSEWRVGGVASPPLGLLYLAAYARRERPGADTFRVEDQRMTPRGEAGWRDLLREFEPDCIGISALTADLHALCSVVAVLKRIAAHIPIVVGGPHASSVGAKLLDQAPVEYVIAGEAEVAFVRFLGALERGDRSPEERISGLCYRRPDGTLYEVPANVEQPSVEELPYPAYDLIDLSRYQDCGRMTPLMGKERYGAIFTSRGCPYRCTYCHEIFKKGFRAMSPSRVVDEMQWLHDEHGVREIEVYDDIFNADHDRALAICREIVKRGLRIRLMFPNGLRGDRLTEELLIALREAGTVFIAFAIESASPRIQKIARKHMKLDALQRNIEIAVRLGIISTGFFMLGFPTETRAEAMSTIEYAASLPLHVGLFYITVPYEGTEMYNDLAKESAALGETYGSTPSGFGEFDHDPNYTQRGLGEMGAEELKRLQSLAYARFYANPDRMLRILRVSPEGFSGVAFRGLRVARYVATSLVRSVVTEGMRRLTGGVSDRDQARPQIRGGTAAA